MRRTPCLLALALVLGVVAAPVPAGASSAATPVAGVLREVVVDRPGQPGPADVHRVLVVDGRPVALPAGALPGNEAGDTVEVVLRDGRAGVPAVSRSRTLARAGALRTAAASAAEPAVHEVYLALVTPRDRRGGRVPDAAAAKALVQQAADSWAGQTGEQVRFRLAQALPAYTSASSCADVVDPDTGDVLPSAVLMWEEALDRFAQANGGQDVAWGVDKHLLVVLPDAAEGEVDDCELGLGTIGGLHVQGNAALVSDSNPSLYAHELGHNLGLHHSGALHCDTADARPSSVSAAGTSWPSRCRGEEYGDLVDVMGYSGHGLGEGSLNGVHLDRMGLSAGAVRTLTGNGTTTVPLVPLSSTGGGVRTVVVTDALGGRYYAEYRTATGRDAVAEASLGASALGLRVLREDPARRNGSFVLDATPTGRGTLRSWGWEHDYDSALPVGRTLTTASGTVAFTLTAATSSGATLTVRRGVPPASVTVSAPARAAAGAPVRATARVRDAAGAAVASWPVTLQVRPVGSSSWVTAATATTGSTGTATFSYANGTSGTYRAVTRASGSAVARTSAGAATTSYAAPTLAAPRATAASGARVTTTGSLRAVPDRVVQLQARLGSGAWTTRARAVRDGSTFTAATRLPRGTWQLRYRAEADREGRYEAGSSAAHTVVVR